MADTRDSQKKANTTFAVFVTAVVLLALLLLGSAMSRCDAGGFDPSRGMFHPGAP